MIQRHALTYLRNWKDRTARKPLIIRGARQVGKTTLIENFAKEYQQYLHFNLEEEKDRIIFEELDDIDSLVQSLFIQRGAKREIKSSLIFIDEIQECPRAIKQLRYFYERHPDIHVIAAGSLLEHTMLSLKSYPVGRVEYMALYPLNFAEFLQAKENEPVQELFHQVPINPNAHKTLKEYFHQYVIVGGMPEVVAKYLESKDLTGLQPTYDSLTQGYMEDVEKYAEKKGMVSVIQFLIEHGPSLAQKRVTFHKIGGSTYKSREVGESLRSLEKARILYLNYPTTTTDAPPVLDLNKKPRMQYLDTGLLVYKWRNYHEILSSKDLSAITRGPIIEHMIGQELQSIQYSPAYKNTFWVRQKSGDAEVDYVYQYQGLLIPIEVKAGSSGKMRSLFEYMDRCSHSYAIRLYAGKYSVQTVSTIKGKEFHLMNLPYYLGTKIPEYIEYLVKQYPPIKN